MTTDGIELQEGALTAFSGALGTPKSVIAELQWATRSAILRQVGPKEHAASVSLQQRFNSQQVEMRRRVEALVSLVVMLGTAADDIQRLYRQADGEAAARVRAAELATSIQATLAPFSNQDAGAPHLPGSQLPGMKP
ncbi:hypothetical protein ABGB07_34130 [Micromonosporaceae bacterium B7E4]